MRVKNISDVAVETLSYKTMAPGGQTVIDCTLPIALGSATGLPENIDALIITSDLCFLQYKSVAICNTFL